MTAAPSWASGLAVPEYLALREGRGPLVVVAPHGGRRRREIRRGDSVNDLGTAALAQELAARTGAHAIVNHDLDRNDIDLNRISHLVSRAPDVLALLAAVVSGAGRAGDAPLVVFVHGWNMVAPCCDIGIGLRRRDGVLTGRYPTLGRGRYDGTIAAVERELEARGVGVAIGRRYTASGRDNAAQLFSGRHVDHDDPTVAALARLAAEGRVDAVQLELGIPLRWDGPLRDALLDGLVCALSALPAAAVASGQAPHQGEVAVARPGCGWRLAPAREDVPADVRAGGAALQAVVDPDGRVALFGGVEITGPRTIASRLCVVCTDGTMVLLVGEGEWDGDEGHYVVDGAEWTVTDNGRRIALSLRGPMIRYRTHEAYLDLEKGLSQADLVGGEAYLLFEADKDGEHGRLSGHLRCGDLALDVDATAFVDRGARRSHASKERLRVLAARPGHGAWIARSDAGAALELHRDGAGLGVIRSAGAAGNGLRGAEILASVPVWRPLGDAVFSRWTFGIVRCRFGEGDESVDVPGLFDRLEVFAAGR